jgi:predicted O-linked N-acetylglucosamine transferase (SPINDLY family)
MSSNVTGHHAPRPIPDDIMRLLRQAMAMLQAGNLGGAESGFKQVLNKDALQFEAIHFLGVIAAQRGNLEQASDLMARSLQIDASKAEAFSNYARVLNTMKRHDEAITAADRALAINTRDVGALLARGNALLGLNRAEDALACYSTAVALAPDFADAIVNQGVAKLRLQRFVDALGSLDRALALAPGHPEGNLHRATALQALERPADALAAYDRAVAARPDYAVALRDRGLLLLDFGRWEEALTNLRQSLQYAPDDDKTIVEYARAMMELGRIDECVDWLKQVLARKPDMADGHYWLGVMLTQQGRGDLAIPHYERVMRIRPDHPWAQFDLCMAQLPALYRSEAEIAERRAAYEKQLTALCADTRPTTDIGSLRPFYLPYQGQDDRALQATYGGFVCRKLGARFPAADMPALPRDNEPVRVGIVSRFFQNHTVWKLFMKGWLDQFNRKRFRLFGYHTASNNDIYSQAGRAACERFVSGPLSLPRWRETILQDAPHVLLYPEIGMDPMSASLGALRLAPVQCVAWGHPETTGYETIDYFLTSDVMEPPGGQAHYTERLVRIPNQTIYYEPLDLPPMTRERQAFRLRPGATVYWCGQSLYKYLPQHDQVLARIAREVGDCQFLFFQFQQGAYATDLLRSRLQQAFAAVGLKAENHCVISPRVDQRDFMAAIDLSDVGLDSIGWSGGNTALECLSHDLPIVTMTGPLMRANHSAAFLQTMGITETVTGSVDEYVSVAAALGRDPARRAALRQRIAETKHRIYCDRVAMSALEDFLDEAVRRAVKTG